MAYSISKVYVLVPAAMQHLQNQEKLAQRSATVCRHMFRQAKLAQHLAPARHYLAIMVVAMGLPPFT